jgi:transcription antitermination factor NusG
MEEMDEAILLHALKALEVEQAENARLIANIRERLGLVKSGGRPRKLAAAALTAIERAAALQDPQERLRARWRKAARLRRERAKAKAKKPGKKPGKAHRGWPESAEERRAEERRRLAKRKKPAEEWSEARRERMAKITRERWARIKAANPKSFNLGGTKRRAG